MPADDPPWAPPCAAVGTDIQIAAEGAAGVVTLRRPRARNALTAWMRAAIGEGLRRWARDPEIYAAILASASKEVFCAGAELNELAQWGQDNPAQARASLADEHALLWRLECFTKPTISLIDGLAMGLGAGLSLCGTHRVAGERYRFAMPETEIGAFPGAGVSFSLARMPGAIGMYLALTGRSIGRADAYRLGLVTHCIAAGCFDEIRREISSAEPVDQVLEARHEDPAGGELDALLPVIARCFAAASPEAIIARLRSESEQRAWVEGVVAELERRSPTSLKITHRHLREAGDRDLRATLIADFRVACRCLEGEDFYEGVRAQRDGDRLPAWRPPRLDGVSKEHVDAFFAPLGPNELQLASRAEMQAFRR